MKRFVVFAYGIAFEEYKAKGGLKDHQDSFDTLELARQYANQIRENWQKVEIEDLEDY